MKTCRSVIQVGALLAILFIGTPQSLFAQAGKPAATPFILGRVEKIKSTILKETRTLNVYLPEGYADTATYPVLYLLDGSANEDFVHTVGIVQFLNMIEAMPKSIVVGIANIDRRRDFTFLTANVQDKKDFPTTGGSAKFISFLEKELKPFVKKKFKTNDTGTLIGQSLGGLLATEVLLKKPALFNNYIIVSPSLWWNDESLLADAPALLARQADPVMKVSVWVGTEGAQMEADARKLADLLPAGKQNCQVLFTHLPEENHLTILHNALYKALVAQYTKKP